MFTPPPSPNPPHNKYEHDDDDFRDSDQIIIDAQVNERKRLVGRKTKWAVVLVPLILVLITAFNRFASQPIVFNFLTSSSSASSNWHSWPPNVDVWRPHRQHLSSRTFDNGSQKLSIAPIHSTSSTTSSSSSSSPSLSSTAGTTSQTPAIPTIPSTAVVPTPFPQPLDSSFQNNFSSVSCYNFFLNMTNTLPFRACRPFSLLLQSSEAFLEVTMFFRRIAVTSLTVSFIYRPRPTFHC
jgi:hypothetical protein